MHPQTRKALGTMLSNWEREIAEKWFEIGKTYGGTPEDRETDFNSVYKMEKEKQGSIGVVEP